MDPPATLRCCFSPRFPPSILSRFSASVLRLPSSSSQPFLSIFPRRLPRPTPRGFSFSCLELGRGLLCAVRTQPLAYNETENLRGTRRMRRMITYIETENRPARSAAHSLSLSLTLSFSSVYCLTASLRLPKALQHFHFAKADDRNKNQARTRIVSK